MTSHTLSEIPDFNGKQHALEFQQRGKQLLGKFCPRDAGVVILLGLIDYLIEKGVLDKAP